MHADRECIKWIHRECVFLTRFILPIQWNNPKRTYQDLLLVNIILTHAVQILMVDSEENKKSKKTNRWGS